MTAQVKALAAPDLKEAKKGVLKVSELKEVAHGVVPPYHRASQGDMIIMQVKTSTGNEWEARHALTEAEVEKPVIFDIPRDVFEIRIVPGATAELRYTVIRMSAAPETSPPLTLKLEL